MPTTRRRLPRGHISAGGITEADYTYFSFGDFFEAEGYAEGKTEEELKAFWMKHKEAILSRFYEDERNKNRVPWSVERWG